MEKEKNSMAAISNDWLEVLRDEFKKPYYKQLFQT